MANQLVDNYSNIFSYLETARFDEQRLAGATIATLTSLKNDSCIGLVIAEKADALWNSLVGRKSLNTAEREVIDRAIASLRSGVATQGQSYEEMSYSKGTKVEYRMESITLEPKNEKKVVIPNHPVPPVPKVETRIHQEWVDPWAMNFDIQAGKVVLNRQLRDLTSVWEGQYSRINLSGLDGLRLQVERILKTSPQWEAIVKDKKSCQGLAFMDMWTTACATCPFILYLSLHDVIVKRCLLYMKTRGTVETGVQVYADRAPLPREEGLHLAYAKGTVTPISPDDLSPEEMGEAKNFKKQLGHYPFMITGPVHSPLNFYAATGASDITTVLAYARMQTLLGAKKRGLGRIAASWNFGPRMSKVWKEINTLCAILYSITADKIDVRVSSGAFSTMIAFLKSVDAAGVRLLLNESQEHLADGLTEADRSLIVTERREGSTVVLVADKPRVPLLDPKKAKASKEVMESAFLAWVRSMPKGNFVVSTKVWSREAFQAYDVRRLKSCFDLSAIVSNEVTWDAKSNYFERIYGDEFFESAVTDMRKMIGWWHAPQVTFSSLATVYIPEAGTLQWSSQTGFEMNPTFSYDDDELHAEDVLDEEDWAEHAATTADEGGEAEQEDNLENVRDDHDSESEGQAEQNKTVTQTQTLPQEDKVEEDVRLKKFSGAIQPKGQKVAVKAVRLPKNLVKEEPKVPEEDVLEENTSW